MPEVHDLKDHVLRQLESLDQGKENCGELKETDDSPCCALASNRSPAIFLAFPRATRALAMSFSGRPGVRRKTSM